MSQKVPRISLQLTIRLAQLQQPYDVYDPCFELNGLVKQFQEEPIGILSYPTKLLDIHGPRVCQPTQLLKGCVHTFIQFTNSETFGAGNNAVPIPGCWILFSGAVFSVRDPKTRNRDYSRLCARLQTPPANGVKVLYRNSLSLDRSYQQDHYRMTLDDSNKQSEINVLNSAPQTQTHFDCAHHVETCGTYHWRRFWNWTCDDEAPAG